MCLGAYFSCMVTFLKQIKKMDVTKRNQTTLFLNTIPLHRVLRFIHFVSGSWVILENNIQSFLLCYLYWDHLIYFFY